ncbi:hypothetical protein Tco_0905505, partial [Tanacetum coccineum]
FLSRGDPLSTLLEKKLKKDVSFAPGAEVREAKIESDLLLLRKIACQAPKIVKRNPQEVEFEFESSYVKDILSNIESMFEDFTLNKTSKIVNPRLFDKLEAQKPVLENNRRPNL